MNMIVERSAPMERQPDTESGKHLFQISGPAVDSHKTVFMRAGWDLGYYEKNSVVTYGHPPVNSTDPNDVIGRSRVYFDGDKMMAEVEYDEKNPKAMLVKQKVEDGYLSMASIRAMVSGVDKERSKKEGIVYFNKQELVDWGIMMHGSNPDANVREIKRNFGIEDEYVSTDEVKDTDEAAPVADEAPDMTEARALLAEGLTLINKNLKQR